MIYEFTTPLADVTLFLATTPEDGAALIREGVGRGRIWSMKEVAVGKATVEAGGISGLRAVVDAKLTFDGRAQDCKRHDGPRAQHVDATGDKGHVKANL